MDLATTVICRPASDRMCPGIIRIAAMAPTQCPTAPRSELQGWQHMRILLIGTS